jgi:drug/metabolite transporter (DMT)-like permease
MPALLLILACALWAVSFPLVKVLHLEQSARLGDDVSSVFLASWMQVARFGLSAVMLLPFVFGRNRPTGNELRQGVVLAFWGGAGMWLQADALAYTEASTSAFLTQAYCIFLPLWACVRTRRGPGMRVSLATVMVLAGGAILSGMRPDDLRIGRGEMETLLAAFLFTFQILCLENPRYKGNRGIPVSFVMFVAIAVMFVPVTVGTGPDLKACVEAGASVESFVLVASLALFCSVGAYVLMNVWQPRVPATEAGLIYTIEPVFTAVYVLFLPVVLGRFVGESYPNEVVTVSLVAGGGLILGANVLMQWRKAPHVVPGGAVE